MCSQLQYDETSADRVTVAALLVQADEVGDLLGAEQFKRRLQTLDARLAALAQQIAGPKASESAAGAHRGHVSLKADRHVQPM